MLLSTTSNVHAADCKGLSASRCDSSASCTWVKSFKRQDGIRVSAYCRKKSASALKETAKPLSKKANIEAKSTAKKNTNKAKKRASTEKTSKKSKKNGGN